MKRLLLWLSGVGLLLAIARAFRQVREFADAEREVHVKTSTLAAAEADQRVRADILEAPDVDPETVLRIRARWAADEAKRVPKFLRGSFGKGRPR